MLSQAERERLIADLLNGTKTRAQVLRAVAEDSDLVNAHFNRAFVLMQYFGYLRRNPNDPPEATLDFEGYNFWLNKLNEFNGNFVNAEMVKAFIISSEYDKDSARKGSEAVRQEADGRKAGRAGGRSGPLFKIAPSHLLLASCLFLSAACSCRLSPASCPPASS